MSRAHKDLHNEKKEGNKTCWTVHLIKRNHRDQQRYKTRVWLIKCANIKVKTADYKLEGSRKGIINEREEVGPLVMGDIGLFSYFRENVGINSKSVFEFYKKH